MKITNIIVVPFVPFVPHISTMITYVYEIRTR